MGRELGFQAVMSERVYEVISIAASSLFLMQRCLRAQRSHSSNIDFQPCAMNLQIRRNPLDDMCRTWRDIQRFYNFMLKNTWFQNMQTWFLGDMPPSAQLYFWETPTFYTKSCHWPLYNQPNSSLSWSSKMFVLLSSCSKWANIFREILKLSLSTSAMLFVNEVF